ncbi:hypothetical protein [Limobrevibacterium gyesilva]|uniref:hypothetical protein n=1 Tax=Limobrevibacterium gyesilva TaxID=2991712 RepID=UPI00324234F4
MSAALASSTAADGHRAITVAALAATYMQAVNISLPNATLLHIQGALSMADDEVGWAFFVHLCERHHHAYDALARGPLRPKGRLSALDRHLRPRRCGRCACGDPDAIRHRPCRPDAGTDGLRRQPSSRWPPEIPDLRLEADETCARGRETKCDDFDP